MLLILIILAIASGTKTVAMIILSKTQRFKMIDLAVKPTECY